MSLVEDSVILLPGEASGKCKAPVGERCVSFRRCCDAATFWKPVGNARFVSKRYMSLVGDILPPGEASRKCKALIFEGFISCQRHCDAATCWKPVGNAGLVSKRYVFLCLV
jgi:hypothetical protein